MSAAVGSEGDETSTLEHDHPVPGLGVHRLCFLERL